MHHDLNVGDAVCYRLHNDDKLIRNNPAKVVSKTETKLVLDNGLTLLPRNGYWVLPMRDRHGRYHTTFYKM